MADRFVAAVKIALPAPVVPIDPVPEVRSTVVAVSVPEVSEMPPAAFKLIVPILLLPPTLPLIAILPDVVARLRTSPEPTVIVDPVSVTLPLLLI